MIPNILSIAGSDPSGGAGVQADLKAIAANGGYGMAALTALTAQNTQGVSAVVALEPRFLAEQIRMVFDDVRVDAVKIGMIANAGLAEAAARALGEAKADNVVLDPVMIATSGDRLLDEDAVGAVRDALLPLARVVTPNLPEAAALLNLPEPETRDGLAALADALRAAGAYAALVKGGHLKSAESPDALAHEGGLAWLEGARVEGRPLHGGGCTLSSALATQLALQGGDVAAAARAAKAYVARAIAAADRLDVGGGARPLNHFPDL